MTTKVEPSSPVESRRAQSFVSMSASPVAGSSPKVSMFGAKSGFVIPKNKLSGSLVPIFRGSTKVDAVNAAKEESLKQVQRKTKWGADLTQDAAVRKGRALAYQTRVEQITQQLKAGALEIGDDRDSESPNLDAGRQSTIDHVNQKAKKFELLELEKREIIGEILRLNPSYKVPPDYKPLLKEDKVPIPIKAYPGYNFIGLLLGPESNAQKRLEEETGAKIHVYGIKADNKEKREITQTDTAEAQGAYEELYVNVLADTYEKVDAAISLIELLLAPVSGNVAVASKSYSSITGDNVNISQSQNDPASGYVAVANVDVSPVVPRPVLTSAQPGQLQFQQQYSRPWFPMPNAPPRVTTGFMPLSMPNNSVRFPAYFNQPAPFGSVPMNPSLQVSRPQLPMQAMQQPRPNQAMPSQLPMQSMQQPRPNQAMPPQNQAMPGQQPPQLYPVMPGQPNSGAPTSFPSSQPMLIGPSRHPAQPNSSTPISFPGSQPMLIGPSPPPRPTPVNMQPGSMTRPLVTSAPPVNFPAWSPQRPNSVQMAPQPFSSPLRPQQPSLPPQQQNMPSNVLRLPPPNFAPPATFPSRPTAPASFTSIPPQIRPLSLPHVSPSSGVQMQAPVPPATSMPPSAPRSLPVASAPQAPVPQPVSASTQPIAASQPTTPRPLLPQFQSPRLPSSAAPITANMPSFTPVATNSVGAPPVPAPKPLRPISGDFTFQPLRTQVPASPGAPAPSSPSIAQNPSAGLLPAPQAPSFRPALQNPPPQLSAQGFPQPSAVNQQLISQRPILPSPPPPRFSLPNSSSLQMSAPRPMIPATQMGPPSFSPAPRPGPLVGSVPGRPPIFVQPQQTQLVGENQVYDPFSPTSISSAPLQQRSEAKARKPETDPEYDDLMASVGLK